MYIGIDVHKRYSQIAVLDHNGEIVDEVRVENANLEEVARQYAGSKAAIEATSNYYTVYDTLNEYQSITLRSSLSPIADAESVGSVTI